MQFQNGNISLSPSDVTAYLGCRHLTTLSLQVAKKELAKPDVENEQAELIFRKGLEHEDAYLRRLIDEGNAVRTIELEPDRDWERAARETVAAMRDGVDVVYQGVLASDGWRGQADFLDARRDALRARRVELRGARHQARPPREARLHPPALLLQRADRADPGARAGAHPRAAREPDAGVVHAERVRRVLPPRPAAARGVRRRTARDRAVPLPAVPHLRLQAALRRALGRGRPPLPRRGDQPRPDREARAAWSQNACGARRRGHAEQRPPGMAEATFERLHDQAALQLEARLSHADSWKLLTPQPASGFALLPDPSPGDLFFDFEGNPFWDTEGSLEYLWGFSDRDDAFEALWADEPRGGAGGLRAFIDLVHARLAEHPDMHVYHYAQYEITALRRMMGRYGTREAELDDLLRREVFVDLYRVVRGGLMISRQGYGLKEIEHLLDFDRTAPIKDGGTSIVEFERWMIERDPAILAEIEAYNREDCIGTRVLADWLLERRGEALAKFGPFPLPEPQESKPDKPEKAERAALREELLATGDPATALAARAARLPQPRAQARLVGDVRQGGHDARGAARGPRGDRRAEYTGASRPEKKSTVFTFTYPAQEQKLGKNPIDQATLRDAGELFSHDLDARELELKRGPKLDEVPLPEALLPGGPYSTKAQEAALERIGALAARARRPLPGDRVGAPPRAVRPRRADERDGAAHRAPPLARRPAPRDPGPAGLGQDVHLGTPDRAARRRRQAGGRRLDEPPRDPQAARGGRRGCGASSASRSAG